jgi:hypothetical protein
MMLRPGRSVPINTLATVANVEVTRAKAYASILIARGALIDTPAGLVTGPAWEAWRRSPPGRPKQGQGDPQAVDAMDDMRRAMADNIRRLCANRGWGKGDLSRKSGVPHYAVARLWKRDHPLPATALILVSRILGTTVEQLAKRGASFN